MKKILSLILVITLTYSLSFNNMVFAMDEIFTDPFFQQNTALDAMQGMDSMFSALDFGIDEAANIADLAASQLEMDDFTLSLDGLNDTDGTPHLDLTSEGMDNLSIMPEFPDANELNNNLDDIFKEFHEANNALEDSEMEDASDIVEGTIITEDPVDETDEDGDGDDDDGDEETTDDSDDDSSAFLFFLEDLLFTEIYAEPIENTETSSSEISDTTTVSETTTNSTNETDTEETTTSTNETNTSETMETENNNTETKESSNKNSSTKKEKQYYLRTNNTSYPIDSDDEYIKYFFSLISNMDIKVSLVVKNTSTTKLSVTYMTVLDELPDKIVKKYDDFCIDKLKDYHPYGVFYEQKGNYYFTDTRTDEVVLVKTDDGILQILIPLISNEGVKVCIKYYELELGIIYVTDVILMEDLPEDIAEEYKKQYKEYTKNILYNFDGYIGIVDTSISVITDYGSFKLTSSNKDILNFIISAATSNSTVYVKVYGYLDSDTKIIDVVQIDY